ncbi:MAG: hypothetical protein ACRDSJ_04095 [Rubrobacteraceae bacterium]
MKVEKNAVLTCSECGAEGEHELLYLSGHLCASRCVNCGGTHVYSGHIYTEYVQDVAERTWRLPGKFAGEVARNPFGVVRWPIKAVRKPFGLIKEISQVTAFERGRRSHAPRRRG